MSPDDPDQPPLSPWQQQIQTQQPEVSFEDTPRGSERIWQQLAPPSQERPSTPRSMITRLFGKGPRGGPNTRAAAEALGVSQRTVQKWIHDRRVPKSEGGQALTTQHQDWRNNTTEGRRHALGRVRGGQKVRDRLAKSRRIYFTGNVKISSDVRHRKGMQIDLSDGDMQLLLDKAAAGDTEGHEALEYLVSKSMFGVHDGGKVDDVYLTIDELRFE